ncbi:hypothetical protein [uncultured Alistipes sp.]|jgi:hypothetical protein|uniref:hypothetical protein n=1 Tax=uncultured Alistipes sp. TaxID=538949 RepID=UPI0025CEE7A7|nr:hypothetical protein [uncultured Alistipes sp.]
MNHEFENIGRELPYHLPEHNLDALRERIRTQTTARAAEPVRRPAARRIYLTVAGVAAACTLIAGLLVSQYHDYKARAPAPDFEQMLSTAPAETLHQAAAENYDDIIYNQQL